MIRSAFSLQMYSHRDPAALPAAVHLPPCLPPVITAHDHHHQTTHTHTHTQPSCPQFCQARGRRLTFEEWMAARPDVCQAREFIHQNPASALAPLPLVLPLTPGPSCTLMPTPVPSGRTVTLDEQRRVLMKRRGSVVGRRSILKSHAKPPAAHGHGNGAGAGNGTGAGAGGTGSGPAPVPGVSDLRHVSGLPVAALGDATVDGLRRLLDAAGAKPGGRRHIVITDLREELVLYVRGTAYLRRELEMPAAALHHAGGWGGGAWGGNALVLLACLWLRSVCPCDEAFDPGFAQGRDGACGSGLGGLGCCLAAAPVAACRRLLPNGDARAAASPPLQSDSSLSITLHSSLLFSSPIHSTSLVATPSVPILLQASRQ